MRSSRTALRIVLCFFLCAAQPSAFAAQPETPAEDFQVYQTVAQGRSLQTSPQFLIVDDFNSGKFVNRRMAPWQTRVPTPGALDIELVKDDARSQSRGYALKANFNLLAGESASFQSFLEYLDVSQAQYFVFMMKLHLAPGTPDFKGRIRLALIDWQHRKVIQDITATQPLTPGLWNEVVIPVSAFKSLDLDQLFQIQFSVIAKNEKAAGAISVDEVAFFGFNDIGFESNRDNLVGYPKNIYDETRREAVLKKRGKAMLRAIAADTWKYFDQARDHETNLVVDHIRMGDAPLAADYTSPTNIALDLMAIVAAMDLQLLVPDRAKHRVEKVMDTLEKMRRYKGFFYNFYGTKKLQVTRSYISTVDTGWLSIALVIVRQAFPGPLAERASAILNSFNFEDLLDPENNHLVVGIEVPERNFGGYHYGMLISEARATSLLAIGKGDLDPSHWWYLYRTPPEAWNWQNQKPAGKLVTQDGIEFFEGHYTYRGEKFVPSWGGSLFEFLMPTLVLDEKHLAPNSLGANNRIVTQLHRDYALKEKKYPVWGISPAAVADGRKWSYHEYGIKALSVKGYPDRSIITPHVSFLALDTLPRDAVKNIRKLLQYKIYGEYGLYDSLDLRSNRVNSQYLALDQGMTLVALCNYLHKGSIQKRFQADPIGKNIEKLIVKESFFKS